MDRWSNRRGHRRVWLDPAARDAEYPAVATIEPRVISVRGLDIRPESLPPDIGAAALELLDKAGEREALSLLYRGALSCAVHRHHIAIGASTTEGEALRAVNATLDPGGAAYFADLVGLWHRVVYAHERVMREPIARLCSGSSRLARRRARMSRDLWIKVAVAVVLAALGVWFAFSTHWETVTVPTPMKGEAVRNPYYALIQFAASLGLHTQDDLERARAGARCRADPRRARRCVRRAPPDALENWVEAGGRLVIAADLLDSDPTLQAWSGVKPVHRSTTPPVSGPSAGAPAPDPRPLGPPRRSNRRPTPMRAVRS